MRKYTAGTIFFDIQKAFDSIWHDALLYKLIEYNFPKYLIHIIASFLRDRKFQVIINSTKSSVKTIPYGVPQGAVLSPCLYNIYVSDAPNFDDVMTAFYADDTALICALPSWYETNSALERATHEFHKFYEKWKINLNHEKTQALLVTRRRTREVPELPFQFNDHEIEWEDNVKYLGVILDRKLTMAAHINYIIEKTQKVIKILYPLIHRKSKLNSNNKLLIFKSALRPIFTYACPIFSTIANTHIQKLQRTQNKILKMIFDLPWCTPTSELHNDNEIELVQDHINRLRENFIQRTSMFS